MSAEELLLDKMAPLAVGVSLEKDPCLAMMSVVYVSGSVGTEQAERRTEGAVGAVDKIGRSSASIFA